MFYHLEGKYTVRLDARSRIRLPRDLHDAFALGTVIYIGPSRYADSLYIQPAQTRDDLVRRLSEGVLPEEWGARGRGETLVEFFSMYVRTEITSEARRIGIPIYLAEMVELGTPGDDVVLFGAYDRLEIMSLQRWARRRDEIIPMVRPRE